MCGGIYIHPSPALLIEVSEVNFLIHQCVLRIEHFQDLKKKKQQIDFQTQLHFSMSIFHLFLTFPLKIEDLKLFDVEPLHLRFGNPNNVH